MAVPRFCWRLLRIGGSVNRSGEAGGQSACLDPPETRSCTEPPRRPGNSRQLRLGIQHNPLLGSLPVAINSWGSHLVVNLDEVRLLAKVREPAAVVSVSGGNSLVRVLAYDAAWNSASSRLVPYGPGPTPPRPPAPPDRRPGARGGGAGSSRTGRTRQ